MVFKLISLLLVFLICQIAISERPFVFIYYSRVCHLFQVISFFLNISYPLDRPACISITKDILHKKCIEVSKKNLYVFVEVQSI